MKKPNVTRMLQWSALALVLVVTCALVALLFVQQREYRADAEEARAEESVAATPFTSPSPDASEKTDKAEKKSQKSEKSGTKGSKDQDAEKKAKTSEESSTQDD